MKSISKLLVSSAGLALAATSSPGTGAGADAADGAAGDVGPRRSSSKMAILGREKLGDFFETFFPPPHQRSKSKQYIWGVQKNYRPPGPWTLFSCCSLEHGDESHGIQ